MTEEQIRALIREEALRIIKEELTIECETYSEFYSSGIRVSLQLERQTIASDTFSFPNENRAW